MLPAGRRNRRIIFQTGTRVTDPDSGAVSYDPWVEYFQVWSEREDLGGTELFRAQQLAAKVTTRYRIPYPFGKSVTPRESLRILDQGRVYDVTYVLERGTRGREGLDVYAFARGEQDVAA